MRRWNGWGDEAATYRLPESAARYLANLMGAGHSLSDAALDSILTTVPVLGEALSIATPQQWDLS